MTKSRLSTRILHLLSSTTFSGLVSFLTTLVLSGHVLPIVFGQFSIIVGFLNAFIVISQNSNSHFLAAHMFPSSPESHIKRVYSYVITSTAFSSAVVVLVSLIVLSLLGSLSVLPRWISPQVLTIASFYVVTEACYSCLSHRFIITKTTALLSIINLIKSLAKNIASLIVLFGLRDSGINVFMSCLFVSGLISSCALIFYSSDINLDFLISSLSKVRLVLIRGLSRSITGTFVFLVKPILNVYVVSLISLEIYGIFGLGQTFFQYFQSLVQPLLNAALPASLSLREGKDANQKAHNIHQYYSVICLLLFVVCVVLYFAGSYFSSLYIGPLYQQAYLILILLLSIEILRVGSINSFVQLTRLQRIRPFRILDIFDFASTLLACIPLAYFYGLIGYLSGLYLLQIIRVVLIRRLSSYRVSLNDLPTHVLSACLSGSIFILTLTKIPKDLFS